MTVTLVSPKFGFCHRISRIEHMDLTSMTSWTHLTMTTVRSTQLDVCSIWFFTWVLISLLILTIILLGEPCHINRTQKASQVWGFEAPSLLLHYSDSPVTVVPRLPVCIYLVLSIASCSPPWKPCQLCAYRRVDVLYNVVLSRLEAKHVKRIWA
jgi:hypothetical protein